MNNVLIGQSLLAQGLITERDIEQALAYQDEVGGLIGQALLRLGALAEDGLLEALSAQLDAPILDSAAASQLESHVENAISALGAPAAWWMAREAVVWFDGENSLTGAPSRLCLAARNPFNMELREVIESRLTQFAEANGWRAEDIAISIHLASNAVLEMAIGRLGGGGAESDSLYAATDAARLREMAEEAPVIDFVNRVFSGALKDAASDIHIEPFEHVFHVRYRVDGVLHTRETQPRAKFDAVASRVKLLSGMDIAERRLPQDGRQSVRFAGQDLDLRVSSLPGTWGESLVLRLLRKERNLPDLAGLGLIGRSRDVLSDLIKNPNGVILVTGPTGSGKSTTLYRALEEVNDGVRKIITIEDPVEYDMSGITQIPVKADIGYTFARGLRAILRQDPDVIMVGEIRDGETAAVAAQAALTGHLVFSTLHTNSALGGVARLTDLGLEPFLVASATRGFAAQRLVRRLCEHCAEPVSGTAGEAMIETAIREGAHFRHALNEPAQWREARGCSACGGTGYRGRIAIFEAAMVDERLHDAILARSSLSELQAAARQQGFLTLMEDGLLKARAGLTSLSEVLRVAGAGVEASAA